MSERFDGFVPNEDVLPTPQVEEGSVVVKSEIVKNSPDYANEKTPRGVRESAQSSEVLPTQKITSQSSPSRNREDDVSEAISRFENSKAQYLVQKEVLVGSDNLAESMYKKLPRKVVAIAHGLVNITRMFSDLIMYIRTKANSELLSELNIEAKVLSRDDFLSNPDLLELLRIKSNKKVMKNLFDHEIFKEIPCEHVLMLKMSPENLHSLMVKLGGNPRAILSDGRGENMGRIAVDNYLVNGKHPFADRIPEEIVQDEMKYWQPVFPNAWKWTPWSKWQTSRTHSVIYGVKDVESRDILFLPVHVDPKNAVAVFGDLLGGREIGEHGAMEYHKMGVSYGPKDVGTGQYDLGIAYFLDLLRRAQKDGKIKNLTVQGEEKLTTSYSIALDDRNTWVAKNQVARAVDLDASNYV